MSLTMSKPTLRRDAFEPSWGRDPDAGVGAEEVWGTIFTYLGLI